MSRCHGICIRYKATKKGTGTHYDQGHKYCRNCGDGCHGIFIKWDGPRCPCCGYPLRHHPQKSETKRRLSERTQSRIMEVTA